MSGECSRLVGEGANSQLSRRMSSPARHIFPGHALCSPLVRRRADVRPPRRRASPVATPCPDGARPPAADFVLSAGDSSFWVTSEGGAIRFRGAPLELARVDGRFYELYVADDDRSYEDAVLSGSASSGATWSPAIRCSSTRTPSCRGSQRLRAAASRRRPPRARTKTRAMIRSGGPRPRSTSPTCTAPSSRSVSTPTSSATTRIPGTRAVAV